jgi:hypothetical protein
MGKCNDCVSKTFKGIPSFKCYVCNNLFVNGIIETKSFVVNVTIVYRRPLVNVEAGLQRKTDQAMDQILSKTISNCYCCGRLVREEVNSVLYEKN